MKIKENENIDTYMDLVRKLKKLWNMKVVVVVVVVQIVVGALGIETGGVGDQRKNQDHPVLLKSA